MGMGRLLWTTSTRAIWGGEAKLRMCCLNMGLCPRGMFCDMGFDRAQIHLEATLSLEMWKAGAKHRAIHESQNVLRCSTVKQHHLHISSQLTNSFLCTTIS